MKRRSLLYAAFTMWAVCGIGTWALAAQQSVTQIGAIVGKNQYELQKAAVNAKLGVIESNFVDLYANKADSSCFASSTAFNACFALDWATGGIGHATSDGAYYASRNGTWASLAGVFASPLGSDDNYVTDAEKTKLSNLSGTNTGDQDLSGYATSSSVLTKTNTTTFTPTGDYHPATKKYVDDAITAGGGYTDEQAQDAVGGMFTGNTETGIAVTYDDSTGKVNFVVSGGGGTWGSITGTLSAQTDLQNALNAKANATGISFIAASLSDLQYDPDTGTADDEYNLITNTGSVGDANAQTVAPTLYRVGELFYAKTAIDTQGEVETIWSVNLTNTISSGTASMGTSAIADGACATVVTVSATGVATTDIINMGFNGTPVGVTGYDPTGTPLNIIAYPTSNNVNFLVCNSTGASVTPGALTINWRVDR